MKKINLLKSFSPSQVIFLYILLGLLLILFAVRQFKKTPQRSMKKINLAIGDWSPYTGEHLPDYGIATSIVTRVFNNIGYEPEYHFMTWPMAEEISGEGKKNEDILGTFPYTSLKPMREKKFYFSDTILNIEYAIFYDKRKFPFVEKITSINELKKYQILAIDGYEYPGEIKKSVSFYHDTVKNNIEAFIELVNNPDSILVFESVDVGQQLLEDVLPQFSPYIKTGPYKDTLFFKLMLSRKNPNNLALINKFNKELSKIKRNKENYNTLQRNLKNKIDQNRAVKLIPTTGNKIYGYKSSDRKQAVLIPNGSKAIVKEWNVSFINFFPADKNIASPLVKIKLLSGPFAFKDSILFIDGNNIKFQ